MVFGVPPPSPSPKQTLILSMKHTYLSILFLLCFYSQSFAQGTWALVYENDAQGQAVQGQLEDLVAAVRDGKSVRIYYRSGTPGVSERFVEHTALVKFFTILNSPEGLEVMGQLDPIIGQTPDFREMHIAFKENLEWSMIASSTGKHDTMMRNVISGEVLGHEFRRWGIKWFVLQAD